MRARPPSFGDWRPGAALDTLRARAGLLAELRAYFTQTGALEVETPLACRSAGTDPSLQALQTRFTGPGAPHGESLYLQTSPEFAMKRLLAGGSGPIYQICKAFRDGEAGRLHNPEFTILEWYRPGFDDLALMAEVAEVLRLGLDRRGLRVEHVSYAALFDRYLSIDVFAADSATLQAVARQCRVFGADDLELDRDGWLDLLLSHLIQPRLGSDRLSFVTEYPASQATLARLHAGGRTAARFEVFYRGVELANGFHELTDAAEQSARFEADNCARRAAGLPSVKVDRFLLDAMEHGLPDCAGVAVGLDRVLMLRLGLEELDTVLSFSLARC